jgi:hypothetical protein
MQVYSPGGRRQAIRTSVRSYAALFHKRVYP